MFWLVAMATFHYKCVFYANRSQNSQSLNTRQIANIRPIHSNCLGLIAIFMPITDFFNTSLKFDPLLLISGLYLKFDFFGHM